MNHHPVEADSRATRIPYRLIQQHYGDRLDDAGDDVCEALRLVSSSPEQYRYRFSSDTSHVNPWYHAMVFEIENLPDFVYQQFLIKVADLGLLER